MDSVFLLGASVRAFIFQAVQAGKIVQATDLFRDFDSQHWLLNSEQFLNTVSCLSQFDPRSIPSGFTVVPLGGVVHRIELMNQLQKFSQIAATWNPQLSSYPTIPELAKQGIISKTKIKKSLTKDDPTSNWLFKRTYSTGGLSVRIANQQDLDQSLNDPLGHFERYQEGDSIAATFATFRQQQSFETRLIGVTQQLVGCPEVNASRFQYCGSIGPFVFDFDRTLEFLGQRIGETSCFHGVWGLDAVVSRGQVVPVDVNPRPTASSELFQSCFADLSQTIPNLLALHLAIHHREFGPREFHAAIDSVRSKLQEFKNAKVILFNDKLDRQIPFDTWSKLASWFRPDFFTNVEFEGWSLADIPPCPGQSDDFLTLPSSAPILTICLRTKDEDPQKKLVDLADKIYQFINSK